MTHTHTHTHTFYVLFFFSGYTPEYFRYLLIIHCIPYFILYNADMFSISMLLSYMADLIASMVITYSLTLALPKFYFIYWKEILLIEKILVRKKWKLKMFLPNFLKQKIQKPLFLFISAFQILFIIYFHSQSLDLIYFQNIPFICTEKVFVHRLRVSQGESVSKFSGSRNIPPLKWFY